MKYKKIYRVKTIIEYESGWYQFIIENKNAKEIYNSGPTNRRSAYLQCATSGDVAMEIDEITKEIDIEESA